MALSYQSAKNGITSYCKPTSAFIFPGQGSQEVGMGLGLYENSTAARRVFEEADKALGTSLTEIMFHGPAGELERTINSQPAILTTSLACLAAANEQADEAMKSYAKFMAGHSLGEYTALVATGAIDLAEAVWLVRERGRLMQEACDQQPGTMAAILGLEEPVVEEICHETGTQIANVNAPSQMVISGEKMAVARAIKLASASGAKRSVPLKVSGAFHSYLMGSAMEGMQKALDSVHFRNPSTPVIANCSGKPMSTAREIKEELAQQLCGCVRWQDSISYMIKAGISEFYEFGPGRVLSGLVKRINGQVNVTSVSDVESARSLTGS